VGFLEFWIAHKGPTHIPARLSLELGFGFTAVV